MSSSREEIGSFSVETATGEIKKVVVSQKVVSYYDKENSFTGKYLNLDSIDGPSVDETERENILRLEDGTELRMR